MIVGGGLAGLAAAMKLAELGVDVGLMSLMAVKRSHSACAQGGINSTNDLTRQLGDSEWKHFDDTVYGGDFLQHQPPVKELAYWAPQIIDLMDRLGVTFNRTPEGFRDQRRFGGTLYQRTAFAGATTGQQLLYALDEQVRRWQVTGHVSKYESWDFLGPILDDAGRCRGCVAQDMASMEIRAFPADAVILASGGCGAIFGRSTNSVACTGSVVSRVFQAGARYANAEFVQVHPTAIPGADKLRLISESARGEGGRVWVPRQPQDPRRPNDIPESERYYFLEDRYPKYGNLVPRDIATREVFKVCVTEGLSVEKDRMCVYLDVSHLPREMLDAKLAGILEIYEKFQGVDPRGAAMKIFPAVHYSMGGLWCDYDRTAEGGLNQGSPRNQQTNLPGLFAIGECDYQFHGANRLGANSLVACIFSGLSVAPSVVATMDNLAERPAAEQPSSLYDRAVKKHRKQYEALLARADGGPNPYRLHAELGNVMTAAATVVRHNDQLEEAYGKVSELQRQADVASLSDKGTWANQNLIFVRALRDMFPLAKTILKGALARDECRGAHYKPEFAMPEVDAEQPAERRRQAEDWCERFRQNNRNWLKSTVAELSPDGEPQLSYEDVDTSLTAPRPRLYGVVGGETIEEVWKLRQASKTTPRSEEKTP
ncbi:MAG: succinate dehydrogenase flavoprotein subunit [Candidatus Nealsonbacteria bacterium]|nr:succinate dehydrogenase flavoprotein subunit [Candidatus Nealsonbacteria bacterium]